MLLEVVETQTELEIEDEFVLARSLMSRVIRSIELHYLKRGTHLAGRQLPILSRNGNSTGSMMGRGDGHNWWAETMGTIGGQK